MKKVRVLETSKVVISHIITDEEHTENVNGFSIHTVFNGHKEYQLGRRNVSIYPGDFLVLNKGISNIGSFDSKSPVNAFSIQIDPAFVANYQSVLNNNTEKLLDELNPGQSGEFCFMENIYPFKGNMRYNLMHLKNYLEYEKVDDLLLNEHVYRCLLDFSGLYQKEVLAKSESLNFLHPSTRKEIYKRINVARDFMRSNYNKALSLKEIAGISCLSVNHLLRTFKDAFNQTPFQFLTMVRLERAHYMLKSTQTTVREVSLEVGFGCPSAFIRAYKRVYGTTPMKSLQR